MKLEHFIHLGLEGKLALGKLLLPFNHSSDINMISSAIWAWFIF